MTENTGTNKADLFDKKQSKDEMKKQVISFALMIALTLVAFAIVATGNVPKIYAIPLLLVMALIQVGFQFYYFMHLKEKGHEMPTVLIYGGMFAAMLVLLGLGIISWW